jgi:phosphosulfolactate phosphohydrolase-like enzyme
VVASMTLVTAASQGRRTLVASSPEELDAVTAGLDGAIVAGHLEGVAQGVFAAPDGPCALLRQEGSDRPLVLASPPGTELVLNAAGGGPVFLACFRNLSATASALAVHSRVALLAAGCREEISCEDQMAAAWIAGQLLDRGFAPEDRHTADIVRRWSGISPALAGWGNSAAALRREGRGDEVEFVLAHVDDVDRPCRCEASEVRLETVTGMSTEGRGTRR